jgi:deoxyribonuclease V
MQIPTHVTPKEAIAFQKKLREKVEITSFTKPIRYIGGADISLNRFSDIIFAGIIVLSYPDLRVAEYATLQSKTDFPYIPGLLSFREAPAMIETWQKLKQKPDILVVDGQGIAHPRRLGIATHIGLMLDIPTIGCAKSVLYGNFEMPDVKAGSVSYLFDSPKSEASRYNRGEVIGAVLRTKDNVKPVIVSPGHKVSLEQSIDIMKNTTRGYRIPEPTRLAHQLVNQFRLGEI